tara:strand:- start:59 stop:382 length:324 start_codon:yes stop_codon:yes gene_type:complete
VKDAKEAAALDALVDAPEALLAEAVAEFALAVALLAEAVAELAALPALVAAVVVDPKVVSIYALVAASCAVVGSATPVILLAPIARTPDIVPPLRFNFAPAPLGPST